MKYKIKDYGNNLNCFVIYNNNKAIFHSNGFKDLKDLRRKVRIYIFFSEYEKELLK